MNEEHTLSLEELGKIKTVKVYNQAYVDKQQVRIETLERENAELEAQIEKMKCCGNCEHFDFNEPNYCYKGMYREHINLCAGWGRSFRTI